MVERSAFFLCSFIRGLGSAGSLSGRRVVTTKKIKTRTIRGLGSAGSLLGRRVVTTKKIKTRIDKNFGSAGSLSGRKKHSGRAERGRIWRVYCCSLAYRARP